MTEVRNSDRALTRAGQVGCYLSKLVERGLQVFDYFLGEDGWVWEVVCVFEAFVAQPGNVEAARRKPPVPAEGP